MKKWAFLGGFLVLAALLGWGMYQVKLDPGFAKKIPSPLIGKPAPEFELPELNRPDSKVTPEQLEGQVWMLNAFASWCSACVSEHKVVSYFARTSGVPVIGLNFKDEPVDARNWLRQLGNPYIAVAADTKGAAGIDWGVVAVPESFIVDKHGVIRHKIAGPISAEILRDELIPLIETLNKES
jgi:cytochrome c biogenesis protein CcmG/thiol:disulfide interchange protein DsbE